MNNWHKSKKSKLGEDYLYNIWINTVMDTIKDSAFQSLLTPTTIKKYEEIRSKGKEFASRYLADKPTEIAPFMFSALWIPLTQDIAKNVKQASAQEEQFTEWSLWLLCSGRHAKELATVPEANIPAPEEYLQYVQQKNAQSTVCGALFKPGSMVITCKDCGMDPTCAICMPCFLASDHKTHDYTIHPSGGGVCDCGDPQAWRPSGFCSKHSGVKEDFNPAEILPTPVVNTAQATTRVIMDLLIETIVQYGKLIDEEKETPAALKDLAAHQISFLLAQLVQIQELGEVFKNIVARQLGISGSFPSTSTTCAMEILIEAHQHFDVPLKLQAKDLYFSLIVDYTFKRVFLRYFIQNYGSIYEDWIVTTNHLPAEKRDDSKESLLDLSVQLFTVPSISMDLVSNHHLLDILLQTFNKCLMQAWIPEKEIVDCDHQVISENLFWRAYVDIKYVLTNKNVAQYVAYSPDLLSKLLQSISLCQGVDPHVRYTTTHIEHESSYLNAINLELNLLRWVEPLLEGFKAGPSSQEHQNALTEQMKLMISYIKIVLETWFQKQQIYFSSKEAILNHSLIAFDVSRQPVSIHLPLHRVLTCFIEECLAKESWTWKIEDILQLSTSKKFVELLIEEPLRIQVLMAQIKANMWVRNGLTMPRMSYSYRCSNLYAHKTLLQDIFIIQLCAAVLDPDQVIITSLARFGLADWFYTSTSDKALLIVAEEFVGYLISLLTERIHSGQMPVQKILRRYIIHELCLADRTHSKLVESIPKPWSKDPCFDEVLAQVSTYQESSLRSSSSRQGTYTLKQECWAEFEGRNFLHYASDELQIALTRYQDICKKNPGKYVTKPFTVVHNIPFLPQFKAIDMIVDSPMLADILFISVYNAYMKNEKSSHALLSQVLILLHYCVCTSDADISLTATLQRESNYGVHFRSSNILKNIMHRVTMNGEQISILDMLIKIKDDKDQKEHCNIIVALFGKLAEKDPAARDVILHLKQEEEMASQLEESQDKKKVKQSQQRILAQFQAQQKAFQMNMKDELQDVTATNEEVVECCLCKDISESYSENPIALVSYCQLSRNLDVADRSIRERIKKERISEPLGPADVHIGNCGHYMHIECFQRYYSSLLTRHLAGQVYEGKYVIDLDEGEYLCPTCRRLSNALLPLVDGPQIDGQSMSVDQEAYFLWMQSLETLEPPPKFTKTALNDSLETLATRLHILRANKKQQLSSLHLESPTGILSFWNSIAATIANAELALRQANYFDYTQFMNNTSKSARDLYYLTNAAFHYRNDLDKNYSVFTTLWENLTGKAQFEQRQCATCGKTGQLQVCSKCHLVWYCTRECQSKHWSIHKKECTQQPKRIQAELRSEPLLCQRPFELLVKLIYSMPRDGLQVRDILFAARTVYHLVIVQIIITAARNPYLFSNLESWENAASPLTQLYYHITSQLKAQEESKTSFDVVAAVKTFSIPYLRCVAIFMNICNPQSLYSEKFKQLLSNEDMADMVPTEEYDKLHTLLELPELDHFVHFIQANKLADLWIKEIQIPEHALKHPRSITLPNPFQFIILETEFQTLLTSFTDVKCAKCQTVPKMPALCLICGSLICVNSKCCTEETKSLPSIKIPESIQHMKGCSLKGIYFLIKECAVFLAKRQEGPYVSGAFWDAIYRDKYGEEDIGFKRGKPLFLDTASLDHLRQLWLNHSIDDEVVRKSGKHYNL